MKRRVFLQATAGAAAASVIGRSPASAQSWPNRPVKLIISFAAGGATDMVGRPWAEALSKAYGQQFVIENRGGASGLIGNEAAFRAAPDGYTFLFTGNTGTVGVPLLRKLNFDASKFIIVGHTGNSVVGFTVHPSVGVKTMQELLDYAKKNPGKLNFGSSGAGTQPHLRYEMLRYKTGVDIAHIPYRGGADSLRDLLAGNIQLMSEASTLPHVKAGKLTMLCVNASQRFEDLPDVPTLTECGVKDADMASWFGVYAPPGTPMEIVENLNAKMNEISNGPGWKKKMALVACIPQSGTLAELNELWANDRTRTAQVIKAAGIKLE